MRNRNTVWFGGREERPPGSGRGIEMSHVTRQFTSNKGVVTALEDVSIDIADGEFVAVLGPSGCGKSTLLRLACGLIKPTAGTIHLNGELVTRAQTEVGIVFQKPTLMPWRTVVGNVLLQAELRSLPAAQLKSRAIDLLQRVGLGDFLDRRPSELSGGMSQRVAIVRALLHDPPLLLMDEPFGALDALTREQMRIDLERIWIETHKTVLFITHSIDEAVLLADRVIVLSARPGRVERNVVIDLPRPRGIDAREHPLFADYVSQITDIFLAEGVLKI